MGFMHWTLQTRVCMRSLSKGREERKPDRAGDKGRLNSEHMAERGSRRGLRFDVVPLSTGGWRGGVGAVGRVQLSVRAGWSSTRRLTVLPSSLSRRRRRAGTADADPRPAFN